MVAFLEDVCVRDDGFEAEFLLQPFGRDGLDAGVNDWEQQRRLYRDGFGFEFADSAKQVFFFHFETQAETKPRNAARL